MKGKESSEQEVLGPLNSLGSGLRKVCELYADFRGWGTDRNTVHFEERENGPQKGVNAHSVLSHRTRHRVSMGTLADASITGGHFLL